MPGSPPAVTMMPFAVAVAANARTPRPKPAARRPHEASAPGLPGRRRQFAQYDGQYRGRAEQGEDRELAKEIEPIPVHAPPQIVR